MRFNKIIQGPSFVVEEKATFPAPRKTGPVSRSARQGPKLTDPAVVEMRRIQEDLRLTSREMVEIYNEIVGPEESITYDRYQMVVQGNLVGQEGLDRHLAVFRKIQAKLHKQGYGRICGQSMRQLVGSWVVALGMNAGEHSIYRELALVAQKAGVEINYSTINRWATNDHTPRTSYRKLLQIQAYVDKIGKKWRPGV